MSARGERLGSSQVFVVHAHSAAHVCGLLESKEYVRAFQILPWTSHSPSFPVSLSPQPTGIAASGISIVKQLFSTNVEGLEFFH